MQWEERDTSESKRYMTMRNAHLVIRQLLTDFLK